MLIQQSPVNLLFAGDLLSRGQINYTATLYVKSEIYFRAGNFDVSPKITIEESVPLSEIAKSIASKKDELLHRHNENFSTAKMEESLNDWKGRLEGGFIGLSFKQNLLRKFRLRCYFFFQYLAQTL